MKRFLLLINLCTFSGTALHAIVSHQCELSVKPLWQKLQRDSASLQGDWIVVGTLTFRKKLAEPVHLTTLALSWQGETLQNVQASLYRTEVNEPFFATDDYWVSDGIWSREKQQLFFKLDRKKALSAITTFHLVLTIPLSLNAVFKSGFFKIDSCSLPTHYQNIGDEMLILQFDAITPERNPA
jgi:hypothetical protein